jgi:hypothetical protein
MKKQMTRRPDGTGTPIEALEGPRSINPSTPPEMGAGRSVRKKRSKRCHLKTFPAPGESHKSLSHSKSQKEKEPKRKNATTTTDIGGSLTKRSITYGPIAPAVFRANVAIPRHTHE